MGITSLLGPHYILDVPLVNSYQDVASFLLLLSTFMIQWFFSKAKKSLSLYTGHWSQVTFNQLRAKWMDSYYWLVKLLQDTITYSSNGFSVGPHLNCAPEATSSIISRLSRCNSPISAPLFLEKSLPNALMFPQVLIENSAYKGTERQARWMPRIRHPMEFWGSGRRPTLLPWLF